MNTLYKWATGILGLWLIGSAFITFSERVSDINLMVVGFLVAAMSFFALVAQSEPSARGLHA
jgi:hypothetical protein